MAAAGKDRTDLIRQAIKWTVYSLLILNWAYYGFDDWRAARVTITDGATLLDWMQAFATTLDEFAWFVLLVLFEAETYWIDKHRMSHLVRSSFLLLRLCCYGFLLHTVYAYAGNYLELAGAVQLAANGLCELSADGVSFLRNLAYSEIDAINCSTLSGGVEFFGVGGTAIVTDAAGLDEALFLAAIDIEDAVVWLAVVMLIEGVVKMQENGVSGGPFIRVANLVTMLLYGVLICNAMYWACKGHWVYAWDELLWIGGFAAIEMNLSEWREELADEAAGT